MPDEWIGKLPVVCGWCQGHLRWCFYDAKSKAGPWGIFCESCFKSQCIGLGVGLGQKFRLSPRRPHRRSQVTRPTIRAAILVFAKAQGPTAISVPSVQELIGCGRSTAYRLIKDIKEVSTSLGWHIQNFEGGAFTIRREASDG